ncbi:MAG TPA: 50S ribosomal protein L9 [Acidobacteriota bacterium]|jgi:large subunit ribosomal protein L9
MQLILKQDVPNLGERGEVVNVSVGYARNFLLPKKLAVAANAANQRELERERVKQSQQQVRRQQEAQELAQRLKDVSLTLVRKASESEALYGSVSGSDIAKALKGEGFDIDRHAVELEQPIKALGIYNVALRLHPEVTVEVKVWVVRE